jgi:transposase
LCVAVRSLTENLEHCPLCNRRKVLQSEGKEAFPEQELAVYLERYDRLIDEGLAANPIPERAPGKRGPKAKGKFRCLLDRFRDFKDDILRFARDWRVPYTNNTAERAIRCARVKERVSGCFRTKSGADDFACVLSFISSAALHGVSSFDAIVAAFRGGAVGVLFGVD